MTFRTLVIAYLVGGLTFLPLLFVTVIAAGWYLLPRVDSAKSSEQDDERAKNEAHTDEAIKEANANRERQDSIGETAASGTFAVLRQYDFQAAVSALNARNSANGSSGNINGTDGAAPGDGASSESVYQSMYRSVFAGRNASSSSLLHDGDAEQTPGTRRKAVPANVMHIVLRHGHLMFYDSPAQVDVKYVISLANHNVSLQADKEGDDADETKILEPDLFTKRTAIVLTPAELPNGAMQQSETQKTAKPFYLFCATNFDKEDFYRALLYTRALPPTPRPLDTDALIKLQSALHSSLLTPETRALNALVGRIFLGVHKTDRLVGFLRAKIERKISRIQKPSFIPLVEIRSIDLGDAAPVYSNLKLRDLNINGDMTMSADVRYNGGLSITILAVAKLDLGPRFKARTVELVLKTSIKRISGTMLHHIKAAPSNRMWFCFESMPEIEVRVEPVVSERKITYGFVLRAIEERVRSAFGEGLVKPNWDDVPMPLQDTRGSHARGSLWLDDGDDKELMSQQEADEFKANRNEKTMSNPTLVEDDTGSSTGLASKSDFNLTKLRHTATMPVDVRDLKRRVGTTMKDVGSAPAPAPEPGPRPPKPLRSPSITAMSPSIAMDDQIVEPVRLGDTTLRQTAPQKTLWRTRGAAASAGQQKDALEGLRDLRARDEQAASRASQTAAASGEASVPKKDPVDAGADSGDAKSTHSRQWSVGSDSTFPATSRSFSMRSTDSEQSTDGTSPASSAKAQQFQQRKANILAAAGAATNAAKNWGWNTYQKNKGTFQRGAVRSEQSVAPNEPMGRGQPLPPPGQPLPGPNKGLWSSVGGTRRKPVPNASANPTQTETASLQRASVELPDSLGHTKSIRPISTADDDFGTWQENSGDFQESTEAEVLETENSQDTQVLVHENSGSQSQSGPYGNRTEASEDSPSRSGPVMGNESGTDDNKSKKTPPPLPARRKHNAADIAASIATSKSATQTESQNVSEKATENDTSEGEALHVPEYAADAIAAENATAALAYGAADDATHVDELHGLDSEVVPDHNNENTTQSDYDEHEGTLDHVTRHELKRTTTEERFARGENVTEEDFEHDPNEERADSKAS